MMRPGQERAEAYALIAGHELEPESRNDPECLLVNMLVDLRQYADRHGLDFGECDDIAYDNYCEDKGLEIGTCRHCGVRITKEVGGSWVDASDGDGCWANNSPVHEPEEAP